MPTISPGVIVALVIGALIALMSFGIGYGAGQSRGEVDTRNIAAANGLGYYRLDGQGRVVFEWRHDLDR